MLSYEHQAQYYETDQMGIIHHSNYIRWMESARIWWMKQVGVDYGEMEKQGVISPVLEVSCQYKSMVHFGDIVLITPKIEHYNGVKLELSYQITDKASGEIKTTGNSKHCFLDRNGKPISLKRSYPMYDEVFRKGMMNEE
ncbi:MAG: thioesterase family protein [Lachnospiraceae bacterium]|nr:thioesterase family protein [Lachnospiraceae bacterium]